MFVKYTRKNSSSFLENRPGKQSLEDCHEMVSKNNKPYIKICSGDICELLYITDRFVALCSLKHKTTFLTNSDWFGDHFVKIEPDYLKILKDTLYAI